MRRITPGRTLGRLSIGVFCCRLAITEESHVRELSGRTAVVTGAASGIGFALARRWGREGMQVILADIDPTALHGATEALVVAGVEAHAVPTDVADPAAVDALATAALDRFGSVHLVCNNAGVTAAGRTWELSDATWSRVLDVNLRGVLNGIRSFVPLLRSQNEGHVVNTASMAGLIAGAGFGAYVVSKHGVTSVSECLYRELHAEGSEVGVSVLCPGYVATPLNESTRIGSDADPGVSHDEGGVLLNAAARRSASSTTLTVDDVADAAAAAVRSGQLWVLTHAGRRWAITERARQIVEARNPTTAYDA